VTSRLVEVDTTNRIFRLEGEQFWELQLHSGASNDDSEGEWWELRTPDGSTYQFGREENSSYNSLQWVRVFVPGGGNPNVWCDDQVGVFCNKAYQWNLERVVDRDGYSMEVFYEEDTNWYWSANTSEREYVRDAQPLRIEYGAGPGGKTHHAKVTFAYDIRCVEASCDTSAPLDPQHYPDVPLDLACDGPTESCTVEAPTFWTTKRLTGVTTSTYDYGASSWRVVDEWVITHGFPFIPEDPDEDPGWTHLWLHTIQRLGVSAWPADESTADLPQTVFDFILLPNRLQYAGIEDLAPQYMPRISQVTNEWGGITDVVYGRSHDCSYPRQGDNYDTVIGLDDWPFGNDDGNDIPGSWVPSNRRRPCDDFHAIDPADGSGGSPGLFRKWKVMTVTEQGDQGNPDVVTSYDWRLEDGEGDPTSTPMWRYRAHDYLGSAYSYWNDYRGNRMVRVTDSTGASVVYTFYQGMEGDYQPTSAPTLVDTFSTSDAVSHTDYEYLVGQVAEVAAYDASEVMLTRTLTDYYAVETFSGEGTWYVRPAETTETMFGSPHVTASTNYTYDDDHGNPTLILHNGTAGDGPLLEEIVWTQSDEFPLMWLPRRRLLWEGASPGARQDAQAVVEYLYDGATSVGTDPTDGRLTKTRYYTVRGATSATDEYVAYNIGYDATTHRPVSYTDPEGTVTGFAYDTDYGFVDSRTLDQGDSLALTTEFSLHPGRGVLWWSEDPNDDTDRFDYDELGRLVGYWNRTRDEASTASTTFAYTNASGGAPARTRVRPLVGGNRLDSYTYYDGFGRVIQTQSPFDQDGDATADDRAVTSAQYNTRGLVEYSSAPWVNTTGGAGAGFLSTTWSTQDAYTRSVYDALGRVTAVDAMSDGTELFDTETAYGTATNRTTSTVTDAEGRWVTHYTDGFGRLVRVAEPNSLDTYYTYTARGELETVVDDDSNLTEITYDILGRRLSMTDPDMGTWTYQYDEASRLESQTDGRGTTLSFVYDDLGRITQRKLGSTVLAEWFYGTGTPDSTNRVGRLTKSRINGNDSDAVVEYDSYDPDGNLLSQDLTIAGTGYDLDFTYYNGGAVEDIVYPLVPGAGSRETVTVTFDGLGHPYDLIGGQTYVDAAAWTAQGQPSVWAFGAAGDITRRWNYDPATLRVTQYKAGTSQITGTATVNLMRLAYTYDDSGNVTRILDYRNSSQYECYGYDDHNRLTDAFTGNSTCSSYSSTGLGPFDHDYAYDNLHNITSLDGPTYSYGTGNTPADGDAGPHAVTDIGTGLDFGYDDNGNRITKTDGSDTTGYTYNPENRLEAVDLPNDADDVEFVYDADGRRVSRSHGDYSTTYVAGLMEIDRTSSTVTEARTTYTFAGTPVAVRTHVSAATTFLFQNHLGSTVAAYNDTTNSHIKQYYYPYGGERTSVGTLPIDQRYTGQTSDAAGAASGDTGLYYYNARYYDPTAGAFTGADTIVPIAGLSLGLNRYAYVAGNPTNHVDPTGHFWIQSRALITDVEVLPPEQVRELLASLAAEVDAELREAATGLDHAVGEPATGDWQHGNHLNPALKVVTQSGDWVLVAPWEVDLADPNKRRAYASAIADPEWFERTYAYLPVESSVALPNLASVVDNGLFEYPIGASEQRLGGTLIVFGDGRTGAAAVDYYYFVYPGEEVPAGIPAFLPVSEALARAKRDRERFEAAADWIQNLANAWCEWRLEVPCLPG
jgi:RHS repeat-associated protein